MPQKLGHFVSEETKHLIGIANQGCKNGVWKGDKVKYDALHAWIKRHKSKCTSCEKCGLITDKLDLTNISGKYKRDINDFKWLCRKCHMEEDGRINNLYQFNPTKNKRERKLTKVICVNCKNEYLVIPSLLNKTKFCSRDCKDKFRRNKTWKELDFKR